MESSGDWYRGNQNGRNKRRKKRRKKQEESERKRIRKTMEIKRVAEEWEIWDEEEEATKSEAEAKKNGTQEVPSIDKGIQEETIRENTDKKDVGPCD